MKISLCMIVKDEEKVLPRCLESVKGLVDEITIADTGSSDRTKEIAARYGAQLYDFPWTDDFSAARNFAFHRAHGDYLMWLDADDVIPKESAALFPKLKRLLEEERPDAVMCPYDTAFEGARPTCTFMRERFLRREANPVWLGRVHECIAPHGKILQSDFRVSHLGSDKQKGARNLHIYQKWAAETPLHGRDLFYYGRELYYNKLYMEAIAVLNEFLENDGWYVNKIEACRILCQTYYYAKDKKMAYIALFRSFLYGEPRAFILCAIGKLFKEDGKWREAIFWYESALRCCDHTAEGDFEDPNCRGITPLLELTCCYYAIKDVRKAYEYHKKAEALAPAHPSVIYNRQFFKQD